MHSFTRILEQKFLQNADAGRAQGMSAYMRHQFEFLGIASPVRKKITREALAEQPLTVEDIPLLMRELWQMPFREYQYSAADILRKFSKKLPKDYLDEFQWLITTKSWWDSVDAIAPSSLGFYLKKYPELIPVTVEQWLKSENIWLIRSVILFQLKYKTETDIDLLFSVIRQVSHTGEFFIDKAVGWALRELSKRYPEEVSIFVAGNKLSPLSVREALKVINKQSI